MGRTWRLLVLLASVVYAFKLLSENFELLSHLVVIKNRIGRLIYDENSFSKRVEHALHSLAVDPGLD